MSATAPRSASLAATFTARTAAVRRRVPSVARLALGALAAVGALGTLGACASTAPSTPASITIFGEQHDQPDQQRQVAQTVRSLAAAGRLGAVVLEMAEAGHDTRALARDADDAAMRAALAWRGWPWDAYAPVVRAAVRSGVPVVGGNLPRERIAAAMDDHSLDRAVPPEVLARLRAAVDEGHCGLLPAAQLPAMTRVQIARDRTLAETLVHTLGAARAERGADAAVLLLAGAQHASRDRGVPLHLPAGVAVRVVMFGTPPADLVADERRDALQSSSSDRCEALRRRLQGS